LSEKVERERGKEEGVIPLTSIIYRVRVVEVGGGGWLQ
jgi:hypothetical protein